MPQDDTMPILITVEEHEGGLRATVLESRFDRELATASFLYADSGLTRYSHTTNRYRNETRMRIDSTNSKNVDAEFRMLDGEEIVLTVRVGGVEMYKHRVNTYELEGVTTVSSQNA